MNEAIASETIANLRTRRKISRRLSDACVAASITTVPQLNTALRTGTLRPYSRPNFGRMTFKEGLRIANLRPQNI